MIHSDDIITTKFILLQFAKTVVWGIFTLIVLYLFLLSIFTTCFMVYTDEHIFYLKDFPIVMCTGLLFLVFMIAYLRYRFFISVCDKKSTSKSRVDLDSCGISAKFPFRNSCITLSVIVFVLLTAMVFFLDLRPVYDQMEILNSMEAFLSGDYSHWLPDGYYAMFPMQNGMFLMELPFRLIFGDGAYLAIQVWNVLMLLGSAAAAGWIIRQFYGENIGRISYILMLLLVPMWTNATLVYGNYSMLCFSLLSIVFWIRFEASEDWKWLLLSTLCIFIALLWKTNAQIFWLTLLIMVVIRCFRGGSLKAAVPVFFLFLGAGIIAQKLPSILMAKFTGMGVAPGIPLISWFAMGLQESSVAPGWFNEFQVNLYRHVSHDPRVISELSVDKIKETLNLFWQNPGYGFRFFARKNASMWADPALQCFDVITTRNLHGTLSYPVKDLFYNGGVTNTIVYLLLDVQQSILYFGVVLWAILCKKNVKLEQTPLLIAFIGGFLYHSLSEAKSQYVLVYYILLVPYCLIGMDEVTKRISMWISECSHWHTASIKEKNIVLNGSELSSAGYADSVMSKKTSLADCFTKTERLSFIGLAFVVVLIALMKGPIVTNTVKLGGQEAEYVWYCQEQIQWKNEDYAKDRD